MFEYMHFMYWCTDFLTLTKVEAVSKAFENYQLKTFGRNAQVHETPEKKKRLKYKTYPTGFEHVDIY